MKPGPKPQSDAQKRAKGETRPSRLAAGQSGLAVVVQFPTVEQVPDAPGWMNPDGKALWGEIAPMLFGQKVLTKADLAAMTHLCQQHGLIVTSYKAGIPPTASDLAQLRLYFSEFGLTPSSRTRVPHGEKPQGNRFGKNGAGGGQPQGGKK